MVEALPGQPAVATDAQTDSVVGIQRALGWAFHADPEVTITYTYGLSRRQRLMAPNPRGFGASCVYWSACRAVALLAKTRTPRGVRSQDEDGGAFWAV